MVTIATAAEALAAARLSTASDPASARAMATAADALAAARLSTASNPASARALFWESIVRGNARAASEAATRVSVPPVEDIAFHFDDMDT